METVSNENGKEIPKEIYVSPEKRQEVIDDLRIKWKYNNEISKNNKLNRKYAKLSK